ncbi:hypothetical protein VTK56DRAFT_9893 [Thermocarpiscus australiensis]
MERPRKKKENPICSAISSWLESLPPSLIEGLTHQLGINDARQQLLDRAPKRWVVYEPMVLLPSGSFAAPPWPALLDSLTPQQKDSLWTAILNAISPASLSSSQSKPRLTHLAINEGIPSHLTAQATLALSSSSSSSSSPTDPKPEQTPQPQPHPQENLLRSPSGLRPLAGDFGPASPSNNNPSSRPTKADFDAALWVSTKQNGILQTWAPRWTMFSRGNVKEKARLLSFHHHHHHQQQQQRRRDADDDLTGNKWAVDLYAGIGYFAFSYARLGLRVLCWELNPWSVEGLRRGALANGWSVRVVRPAEEGEEEGGLVDLAEVVGQDDSSGGGGGGGGEQIVVFLEDNKEALRRVRAARDAGVGLDVVHVNCGFLPSSEPVWRAAWEIRGRGAGGGWLHLHENVGAADVERRKGEIQQLFDQWRREDDDGRTAKVEHVELVKTFAPGVWHCVFDVYTTRSSTE